jgi:hypothetical protein
METIIRYSCGYCGVPMTKDHDMLEAPEGYDPCNYEHSVCQSCYNDEPCRNRVTRDMAIDAGDPSLEGQLI